MPYITIRVFRGALSEEKKREMMSRVSETVAEIEARPNPKENLLSYVWCVIEEVNFGDWGLGGNPVTPETLKALLEGKA